MTFTEMKMCVKTLKTYDGHKSDHTQSQLRCSLYISLGYFDGQGNPKSRRMRKLAGQITKTK